MSVVSSWVLSIAGIIMLSVLVDVILPDGKVTKFIKSIFSYLIIIVILSPIFSFLSNKTFSVNDIFQTSAVELQDGFIAKVNRQFLDNIEIAIEKDCEDVGYKFVEIGIEADIFQSDINIKQISVDLSKMVIDKKVEHTNIKTSIKNIILNHIKIDKELIVFYE